MSVTVNYLEEKRDSMEEAPPTFQEPDYPKNAWYAAAWDVELKQELLARRICDQNLVMYRRRDGRPVALQDACWHRMLPLSRGKLVDDDAACGYHGLIYNSQGRCVFMPSQNTINPAACVKSYPVVERHRFIWVWREIRRWRTRTRCPTCTGTTTPTGSATATRSRRSATTSSWSTT